jgi:hypothetical protein
MVDVMGMEDDTNRKHVVPTMNDLALPENDAAERERILQRELEAAQSMNRKILRQLKQAQESAAEALRAHAKMVSTLTETMRENIALTNERDIWKARAQRRGIYEEPTQGDTDLHAVLGIDRITETEARAIRKTMARIHHPDAGGDPERMKAWNAALDQVEHH